MGVLELKRKIIIGACTVVAIALFSTAYVCNINSESKASKDTSANTSLSKNNSVGADFSEVRYSQDDLIKNSGVVVRCTFGGEKETKERTTMTTNTKGHKYSITALVTTYKMKLVESLKGSPEKYIDVVTLGSGNEHLETGEVYVLFLNKNKSEDTYRLISYSQGLNIVKQKNNSSGSERTEESASLTGAVLSDESIEIQSAETREVMNYKELKDRIKALEK
jgi:hypothetical protein